ncbi:MAG: PrsW family intramembrane metalloprotease [Myxococcota bacterium]
MSNEQVQRYQRQGNQTLRFGCLTFVGLFFVFCVLCSGLYGTAMFMTEPGFFIIATILATMTAVPYGALLWWLDHNEPEPVSLLVTSFLWGACVSTMLSIVFNTTSGSIFLGLVGDAGLANFLTASLSAPFFEELTKGAAVMLLFFLFRQEFDNVLDGIVYGAFIGLGFAWFENITYYLNAAMDGGMGGMLQNAWARGVVSATGGSHAAYTALTGAGFGLVRMIRRGALRWLLIPLFLGLSMFAHFAWNTFVGPVVFITSPDSTAIQYLVGLPIAVLILQMPFTLLLVVTVMLSWRHENRIIRKFLREAAPGVVTAEELSLLVPTRRRIAVNTRRFFSEGPSKWWLHKRLARNQIDLAFLRWHHEEDKITWEPDQDKDILLLRRNIKLIRAQLA